MNWVLHEMFRHRVNRQFHERVLKGEFGGVLALSPMIPRYAMPLARACGLSGCPLVIGPVNGGLDYPKGWKRLAFSEGAWLHPLRYFASNYPPFKEAYLGATKVLCGSWNCLEKIQGIFPQISTRLSYCPENGLDSSEILPTPLPKAPGAIHLIFVGRLVDYKGPMILLKALNLLSPELKKNVTLQVVGDGALKITMQKFCQRHHLENLVSFTGQLTRDKVLKSLSESDLLVFPSVREFGGGVVLESFSQGCPVLIANRGGPAELAGIGTGYRCPVHAPNKMTMVLADLLGKIISSPKELDSMRSECLRRAREFTWDKKALEILNCFDSGN
jgi:glycosyltransferase involved in cell wall biosynthesis